MYDVLAKSESAGLGLKNDIRSAIEGLALKQMLQQTQTTVRWVHIEAMLADGVTKFGSAVAKATIMEFAESGFWRLVHDERFVAAKKRDKKLSRLDAG